jgi:NAD-dependent DNA ligase
VHRYSVPARTTAAEWRNDVSPRRTAIQFDESLAIAGWHGAVPSLARTGGDKGVEALGGKLCDSLSNPTDLVVVAEGPVQEHTKSADLGPSVPSR